MTMKTYSILAVCLVMSAGCSESASDAQGDPVPLAVEMAKMAPPFDIPAGAYKFDPNHARLTFVVAHMGLSNYQARFTDYEVKLDLDPVNPAASSVTVLINPASVKTDYSGDYKAGHADSPYESWDDDLSRSPNFFNSDVYPKIMFQSTKVEPTGSKSARITGDLTFLGKTLPVTLDTKVVGAVTKHPFGDFAAIGFEARGSIKRSDFGMSFMQGPNLLGDTVTIEFGGEFVKDIAPAHAE